VRQAEAVADSSLAAFDGTVLTALREVEQALARYDAEMRRNRSLRQAEAASANALDLSRKRFDYGADSFLQLIDAQSELAAVRASRAGSDAALAEAQVSLFKALGGGWQDAPEPVRKGPKSSAAGE
jgi:outer membrane protein TolC